MKVIIDRFEGDMAVVELPDGSFLDMPIILMPDAVEGDVISIEIDRNETATRKEKIKTLMNKVFDK